VRATFSYLIIWSLVIWSYWAFVTPLIFKLGQRLPLNRENRISAAAIHFFLALVFGLTHIAIFAVLGTLAGSGGPASFKIFIDDFNQGLRFLLYVELVFYWAILGAGIAKDSYQKFREREISAKELETKLSLAQLQALKMQIQPHFLFNALNTVAMLIRNRENDQAVQMVAGLGDLLRSSLNDNSAQEVPLSAELDFIGRYLAIEQFRFPDRLRVEVDVPADLMSASVPNLILQPLVENAIRHGVAKSSSAGWVRIAAKIQDNWLELSVQDDGPGLSSVWMLADNQGIGLGNTRDRLRKLFDDQQEFAIENAKPTGAKAVIKIPYRQQNQAESHAKVHSTNR
jgi:two-component system LytT family sensor kinase